MLGQTNNALSIPRIVPFDGNIITPGTPFMARLATHMRQYLEHKTSTDPAWEQLQVH